MNQYVPVQLIIVLIRVELTFESAGLISVTDKRLIRGSHGFSNPVEALNYVFAPLQLLKLQTQLPESFLHSAFSIHS